MKVTEQHTQGSLSANRSRLKSFRSRPPKSAQKIPVDGQPARLYRDFTCSKPTGCKPLFNGRAFYRTPLIPFVARLPFYLFILGTSGVPFEPPAEYAVTRVTANLTDQTPAEHALTERLRY